jgi:hypothetical protein
MALAFSLQDHVNKRRRRRRRRRKSVSLTYEKEIDGTVQNYLFIDTSCLKALDL